MMPGNFKYGLIENLFINAMEEVICLDTLDPDSDENENEEINDIMETLEENLEIVLNFRYGIQRRVPKNNTWFNEVLLNYDDDRFKQMLRVSRAQFNIILKLISSNDVFHGKRSSLQHSVFFQLSLVLYRLGASGEGASISKIAALFGVGDGETIQRITMRVFKSILDLKNLFIKWPNLEEKNAIVSKTFQELPHCIGYLDGCEIPLNEAPSLDPTSFYSRKKIYSIKLQAICDPDLKIRHICVGHPGSVHDARVFANSSIGSCPTILFKDEEWLAADSAYKLTKNVITPYRNYQNNLSRKHFEFNKKFSKYRVRIEHCFGFLKEKFNSLKGLKINIKDADSHKFPCAWITVCCILHNVILPHWESDDFNIFLEQDNINEVDQEPEFANEFAPDRLGYYKREALSSIILNDN